MLLPKSILTTINRNHRNKSIMQFPYGGEVDGGGGGGGGDEPRSTDAPTDGTRTRCSLRTQGNLEQEALEDRKGDGFRSPDPAFVPASAKRARSPSSGRADPHCKRKFPLKKKKKKSEGSPGALFCGGGGGNSPPCLLRRRPSRCFPLQSPLSQGEFD